MDPIRRWRRPLAICAGLLLMASRSWAAPVELKMGTLAPEGSSWMNTWNKVAAELEERSPVPVKIVAYPGGVMGDEPDLVRKLRFDQLQIVGVTVSGVALLLPELLVLALPFLFESYDEVDHVIEAILPDLQRYALKRGVRLLAVLDQGMINLYSQHELHSLSDLRERKVWLWNANPIDKLTQEALGLNGVPISVPEVMGALQTGLIDTMFSSPTALVAFQWYTQYRYQYPFRIRYEPAIIAISERAFRRFPESARPQIEALLREAAKRYLPALNDEIRKGEETTRTLLAEQGLREVSWSPEALAELRREAHKAWEAATGDLFPAELLQRVQTVLAEYRARKGGKGGAR